MSLGNYVSACRNLIWELKNSLSSEDIQALAADYAALLSKEWVHWLDENDAHLHAFVIATPAARRAKRAWQAPVMRRRLTLAAIFHLQQAEIVLNTVFEMNLEPGGSYRGMAAAAGEAYNRIVFDSEVPLWPFEDEFPLPSLPT